MVGGWCGLSRSAKADKVLAGDPIHEFVAEPGINANALAGIGTNGLP